MPRVTSKEQESFEFIEIHLTTPRSTSFADAKRAIARKKVSRYRETREGRDRKRYSETHFPHYTFNVKSCCSIPFAFHANEQNVSRARAKYSSALAYLSCVCACVRVCVNVRFNFIEKRSFHRESYPPRETTLFSCYHVCVLFFCANLKVRLNAKASSNSVSR